MEFDGERVDHFYHVILPTDDKVIDLAREVGLDADSLRFVPTGVGFFHHGRMESVSTISDFLRFSLLSLPQRIRLGAFVAYCQRISGWEKIDHKPLAPWVTKLAGRGVYERMWDLLLRAKFDDDVEGLSATWLWSRTRRMSGARRNGSQEFCGALTGGYQTLCDRLSRAHPRAGRHRPHLDAGRLGRGRGSGRRDRQRRGAALPHGGADAAAARRPAPDRRRGRHLARRGPRAATWASPACCSRRAGA